MTGGGGESMVIYMEIEGIKLAYQLTKDAARVLQQIAKFLICSMADAPYKKTEGRTNRKNMQLRSNGQPQIPVSLDKKTYEIFKKQAKKYGILFRAFKPLRSGRKGTIQLMILEKDLQMMQELLERIKEKQVKEDVKSGMKEGQAEQIFRENNHTESMEEFVENIGAASSEEIFDNEMKDLFGENYQERVIDFVEHAKEHAPKSITAGMDSDKVNSLADIIQFKERAERLNKNPIEISFVYDQKNGKSQIVEETETHVKIEGKGLGTSGNQDEWSSVWIPKDMIVPPLGQEPEEGGRRTVRLPEAAEIIIENPVEKRGPRTVKADTIKKNVQPREEELLDITISKKLLSEENERAVKTRVPGTWGSNIRYLWMDKNDIQDVYGGRSMLTSLDSDKYYELYSGDDRIVERVKGRDLYKDHYDPVSKNLRKSVQALGNSGAGMGRSL